MSERRVAVVGGGWAGLAAAVEAVARGHTITLYEMAPQCGGRARSATRGGLDNGQHILIGAYRDTLRLMQRVGVEPRQVLRRLPLALQMTDGRALRLPAGPAGPAFLWAVLRCSAWTWRERLALLTRASRWAADGFTCDPTLSVDTLCATLPRAVRSLLVDPLCVAALNTPASDASARVFLRVLHEGLFGGPGASDLLLPCRPLQELLPRPAEAWLRTHGAIVHTGHRVMQLSRDVRGWSIDGESYDHVVLACSAREAARLVRPWCADWAAAAEGLSFEPIVTVWIQHHGLRGSAPMLALPEGPRAPAQFVFNHGAISGRPGLLACVVSGAARWVEAGLDETAQAVLAQVSAALPAADGAPHAVRVVAAVAERRATFRCTPALVRPQARIAQRLWAAGDYIDGPYPATLEGAVRSGITAVASL